MNIKAIWIIAIMLCYILPVTSFAAAPAAIAVWAFPDSSTVKGNVKIGVVAYHRSGITKVDFSLDGAPKASITEETLNTDTGEFEYVLELNTATLLDGEHTINAVVIPNPASDTSRTLPDLIIHVANNIAFNTWYVSTTGNNDTGDGSSGNPWLTLGRALGTDYSYRNTNPRAMGGDTVLVEPGTYDLPYDKWGTNTKYITIKPHSGTVLIKGGVLRSSFFKFENISFNANEGGGGVEAYGNHIWFKNCTYVGYGKIWPDTVEKDEFFRNRDVSSFTSGNCVVEGCTIYDGNYGITLKGSGGNYIARNNTVYDMNGDALKWSGNNVLYTGNIIHNITRPPAWSCSKNAGPYDCTGITLTFYVSDNYGSTYTNFNVALTGSCQTVSQVATQLNGNSSFINHGLTAEVASSVYPCEGNILISRANEEISTFYITGDTSGVFKFSDNSRNLNDISVTCPAKNSTDHNDYMANDSDNNNNIVIRNNKMYGKGQMQGIKIAREYVDGYKSNTAIVNNLIAGDADSARFINLYDESNGGLLYWTNILIAHNTIMKPSTGTVRTNLEIDLTNRLSDITIKNNILGDYYCGDYPLASNGYGDSDYNLFSDDTYGSGYTANTHSILGNPHFTNANMSTTWDFRLGSGSSAIGKADPSLGIKYDIDWNLRSLTAPSIGAYEYGASCPSKAVHINETSNYYDTVSDAYAAALTGQSILMQEKSFTENLSLTDDIIVALKGGYNCDYSPSSGFTTISGVVTIGGLGKATIDKLIIK
jgi:parallel beta-helix repeat protein